MESIVNNIENIETEDTNFDLLYQSFDSHKKKDLDKYDTITFYYNFNNEKIKYQTKIKKGDSITLKKYIKDIYNRDLQ